MSTWGLPFLSTDERPACSDGPDLWFEPSREAEAEARSICRDCPFQKPCAEWALVHEPWLEGMWGGLTDLERKQIRAANDLNVSGGKAPWAQHARVGQCPKGHPLPAKVRRFKNGRRRCDACESERVLARRLDGYVRPSRRKPVEDGNIKSDTVTELEASWYGTSRRNQSSA